MVTRAGCARFFAALVAGVVCSVSPLWAVSTAVGGRDLDVSGWAELRQVLRVNHSTPRDLTLQQIWMDVRFAVAEDVTLQGSVSAQNGGPTTKSGSWGVYGFETTFQSISPSLDLQELFVDFHGDDADLRVGLQKFAWGKLDRSQPTDILNAERYADPLMLDETERKIGVPAVQGSYYLPRREWLPEEARVTAVWVAKYSPFRFPRVGERWFPPAGIPPDTFTIPPDTFPLPDGGGNPAIEIPVGFRTHNESAPGFQMKNAGYAAKFAGFAGGVDFGLYYYHGFDPQPSFRLTAALVAGDPSDLPLGFDLSAETELSPVFRTINLGGADAAYTWRDFTFRLEGAFVAGRPFPRDLRFLIDDPSELADEIRDAIPQVRPGGPAVPVELPQSFVVRDALEWGVGADYRADGYTVLVELNQTDVFRNAADLLIADVETRMAANLQKRFWHDDFTVELIGLHAFESDYTLLRPRLAYLLWDHVELSGGYLFVAGRRSSVVGQYKRNDQGFLRLRYLF